MSKWSDFLFSTSSRSLRKKQIRTLWLAIVLGIIVSAIIGVVLYVMNRQGRI